MDQIAKAYNKILSEAVSDEMESITRLIVQAAKRNQLDPEVKNFFKSRLVRMNNGTSISVENSSLEVYDKNQKLIKGFSKPKLDYAKAVEVAADS